VKINRIEQKFDTAEAYLFVGEKIHGSLGYWVIGLIQP